MRARECKPQKLREPRPGHRPGQSVARRPAERFDQQERGDQEQVQQDRRRGGCGKPVDRVQHTALQRDQRDEQQIGKGDPGELDGKPEFLRVGAKAGCDDGHYRRHENFAEQNKTE